MRKFLFFACFALTSGVFGQQIAVNSQYLFNEMLVNPGAAGAKEYIPVQVNFRKQWAGFPGAPTTQYISTHANLGNNFGLGGMVFNDVAGPSRRTGLNINGSYHLKLDRTGDHRLGLGLGLALTQHMMNENELETYLPEDPAVLRGFNNQLVPDANFGAFYYFKDKAFVGLSAHNLVELDRDLYDFNTILINPLVRNYYFIGGYNFELKHDFGIKVTALGQMIETTTAQFDLTMIGTYKNRFWLGASYRHTDALVILGGFQFGPFKVGYAYDYTLSDIINHSTGSHEVLLELQIFKGGNGSTPWLQRNRIYSPRI